MVHRNKRFVFSNYALLFIILFVAILLCIIPFNCQAEESVELVVPAVETLSLIDLEHNGSPGVWLHTDSATRILRDLRLIPLLRQQITLLEERSGIRDAQVERLQSVISLSGNIEQNLLSLVSTLSDTSQELSAEQLEHNSWYLHPALWVTVGFVLCGAVFALAVWALNELDN